MKLLIAIFFAVVCGANETRAEWPANDQLYRGAPVEKIDTQSVVNEVAPGSIVIIGEHHQFAPHQNKQMGFMQRLSAKGLVVSVGMEFLSYPYQSSVDAYLTGTLAEADFLKQVRWGDNDFNFYRKQILFPRQTGGTTIALNAPRELTSKVAKQGLSSLNEHEQELLPPNFSLGSDRYFERFWQAVGGHHVPREKAQNYFAAQSIWDDTMAWKAVSFIEQNPNAVLVIVVGDFHVVYGGGLPDRLRARGAQHVITISQVDLSEHSTAEDAWKELQAHPNWGPRADYIWTSKGVAPEAPPQSSE